MKNINEKFNMIFNSLVILAILITGTTFLPAKASADRAGYVTPYNATRYPKVQRNDQYNYNVGPNVVGYTTPTVYSNTSASPAVTKTTTTTSNTNTTAEAPAEPVEATEDSSDLVASVVFGSASFLPSGIIQWILMAIFILVIVILARKIFGGEKKFHDSPMKHA